MTNKNSFDTKNRVSFSLLTKYHHYNYCFRSTSNDKQKINSTTKLFT